MLKKGILLAGTALLIVCPPLVSRAAPGRDYISIVGSSTVYPFATAVAEQFGRTTKFKTPKIESTGSGGGLKLFCAGSGINTPDITNASRRIKPSEYARCRQNGVDSITEVKIGYDGIVLANARTAPLLHLSKRDIYLALAKEVPDPDGLEKLVANPYRSWREINAALPDTRIEVLGPPPTSGTRDAFAELVMEGGCRTIGWLKAISKTDPERFSALCQTVREDGAYIEAGENDNLIVHKLEANHKALGIFGFSYLDQNSDRIQGALIEGVEPTFANIAVGRYPVSRPLFFYIKNAHVGVVPGMREYVAEFTSDRAWGPEGYLADKGLIPMPETERRQGAVAANALTELVFGTGEL
jgi:phosphate transport system substrate-binding protein